MLNEGLYEKRGEEYHADRLHSLAILGQEHILGMVRQNNRSSLLSLNQQGEIKAHPLNQRLPQGTRVYFMQMGSYNSEFVGYPDRKNIFAVGEGRKQFTGGDESDSFLLLGAPEPEIPGILRGGRGEDWLVVSAHKNYRIDLQHGYVQFSGKKKKLAEFYDIEHIEGHEGRDDFIGNEKNNRLLGKGGNDQLQGKGGNDTLSLQEGTAQGGTGTDLYHILSNTGTQDVTIAITEPDEDAISYIWFEQRLGTATEVHLSDDKTGLRLIAVNENGTRTFVHLNNVYVRQGNQLQRYHDFRLYDADGRWWSLPEQISPDSTWQRLSASRNFGGFYAQGEQLGERTFFIHQQNGDRFQSKFGLNHYVIYAIPQDILQLDWEVSMSALYLNRQNQDLLIPGTDAAIPQIRITNFYQRAGNHHLQVRDKNQNAYQLTRDETTGQAVLQMTATAIMLADEIAHFPSEATGTGPDILPSLYPPAISGQLVQAPSALTLAVT